MWRFILNLLWEATWEISSLDTVGAGSDLLELVAYTPREPVEKLSSFKKCFRLRISNIINRALSYRMSESNALYLYGLSPQCWTRTDFQMINQDRGSRKHHRRDRSSSPQTEFLTLTIFIRKDQHPDNASENKWPDAYPIGLGTQFMGDTRVFSSAFLFGIS